jgi:AcrR family transcriptional regulator
VLHWIRTWIDRYEFEEYALLADRVSDLLLRGLASERSRWQAVESESSWRLNDDAGGATEAFLRAATALVNEQGYRGASVDKISARLNVTKGSFYHHNDNKHDLITECFERSFAVVRRALDLAESQGHADDGWSRVCAAARAMVRFQLSVDGPLLRATATSALPDELHRQQVRLTMNRLTQRVANVLVDGMMDGSIRPLDPAIAAQGLIAAINAAAELHRWLPGANAQNVASLYLRPVFDGVLCPGASAT